MLGCFSHGGLTDNLVVQSERPFDFNVINGKRLDNCSNKVKDFCFKLALTRINKNQLFT